MSISFADGHKLRPNVIQIAIENLNRFYDNPSKWLQSVTNSRTQKSQERSEARDADVQVLGVILHYTELSSMRVGIPDFKTGDFISLDMRYMAKKIGWRTDEDDKIDAERVKNGLNPKNKGLKRFQRCIARLKRAGYITLQRRTKSKQIGHLKQFKELASVKTINPKLFTELGVSWLKLEKKRKEATNRLKKLGKVAIESIKATITPAVSKMLSLGDIVKKAVAYKPPQDETHLRQIAQARYELRMMPENQSLTAAEFYEKYPHLKQT